MSLLSGLVGVKLYAVGAAVLAVAFAGATFYAYQKGKAADKQRSDLVIERMVSDAAQRLLEANARNAAVSANLQATKERAERELQSERQTNARRIADAVATDRIVREQITDFARGPGASEDTVAACRADARALGDVLDSALRAHAVCSGHAETEAGTARTLLRAWPIAPAASGASVGTPLGG